MNVNLNFNHHILELQRGLGILADGKRGLQTNTAIIEAADEGRLRVVEPLVVIKPPALEVDLKHQADPHLKDVHPDLVALILEASVRSDIPFDVIEGRRTLARQKELVEIGASKTHDSRHLTGHAVDLWPQDLGTRKNLPSDAAFPRGSAAARNASARLWKDLTAISKVVKDIAKERGILVEWGGDWGWDAPHFQLNRAAYPA